MKTKPTITLAITTTCLFLLLPTAAAQYLDCHKRNKSHNGYQITLIPQAEECESCHQKEVEKFLEIIFPLT